MRSNGVRECLKAQTVEDDCLKSRTVEDEKDRQYKEKVEERISLFYSLYAVCTLYAVCMHSQLHTFSCPQPYGHAYSRFCMHCMQSFSELCSRIACIVGFLVHTMHTTFFDRPSRQRSRRNGRNAYTPAETCDDRETRMGRDGGGRPVRRATKARKKPTVRNNRQLKVIHGSSRNA